MSGHHVAEGHGAAGGHAGGDCAGRGLPAAVSAHVTLQLSGRLAVDAAQVTNEDSAGGSAAETPGALLPLLSVMLLGMDAEVRQCGEAAVAQMADVVL